MPNKRLGVVEFGRQLIETGDLDPVYIALWKSKMSGHLYGESLKRWIVAWMCYYHCGLNSLIIDKPNFFGEVLRVARASTYPRGSQRVHHRGPPAVNSALALKERFKTATDLFKWLVADGYVARTVFDRMASLVGFGPCMSWRVPDIAERLGMMPTRFVDRDVDIMYDNPMRGAIAVCEQYGLGDTDRAMQAHLFVMGKLATMAAPPRYDRAINIQETETIFCKWKSHIVGRYEIGRDTARARAQLLKYPRCRLNQLLTRNLPKVLK